VNQPESALPVVFLRPGEIYFSGEPSVVVTVLGSCLSVTMFCRRRGLGGICHGILPQCGGHKDCPSCHEGFKYIDCAIRKMVSLFDQQQVSRGEIEVKCFGGADMFTKTIEQAGVSVGRQNIASAERVLASEGLRLQASDVGGILGRKIFFYTHTGDVLLKRLRREQGDSRI
jgi:chemotaxis protein CheD